VISPSCSSMRSDGAAVGVATVSPSSSRFVSSALADPSTTQNGVGENLGFACLSAVLVQKVQEFLREKLWCGVGCEVGLALQHGTAGGWQSGRELLHR